MVLPQEIVKKVPKGRLMSETEWRALGVQQSRGWVHYAIHRPEPHILLYRRPKGYGTSQQVNVPQVNVPQVAGGQGAAPMVQ